MASSINFLHRALHSVAHIYLKRYIQIKTRNNLYERHFATRSSRRSTKHHWTAIICRTSIRFHDDTSTRRAICPRDSSRALTVYKSSSQSCRGLSITFSALRIISSVNNARSLYIRISLILYTRLETCRIASVITCIYTAELDAYHTRSRGQKWPSIPRSKLHRQLGCN